LTNITLSYNPVDKILYEPLLLSINNYIKINDHLITNYIHDSYVSEFDDDTVSVVSNDTTQEEEDSITVIDTTINIIEED
jgi:hypothetical protein